MENKESLGKKAGYLKGLLEGIDLAQRGTDGKLAAAIVDLLGDLVDRVESVEELVDDLDDYVESIDDDLSKLEGEGTQGMPDMNDDADEYADDLESAEDQLHLLGGSEVRAEEEILSGCICPVCGGVFFVDKDDDDDADYACPYCENTVRPIPLTPENVPVAKPAGK